MEKLTMAQIKEQAKVIAYEKIKGALEEANAIVYGAYKYAIPVKVGEQELFVKVEMVAGQYTDTKVALAFDPVSAFEEYEADRLFKAEMAQKKAEEKAKKVAKAKAK